MVFDDISLVDDDKKRKAATASKDSVKKELKKLFRMAKGFYSDKNYSNAFYFYYLMIKKLSSYYVQNVLNQQGIPENDALEFLAKNDKFEFNEKKLEEINEVVEKLMNLGKATKKECSEIKKIVSKMRKKVLK